MKLTVLGNDELTLSVPAVIVSAFAIPNVDPESNWSDVPLIVTL